MEQTTEYLDDAKLASLDMTQTKFLDDDDDDELPVFNVKQTNEGSCNDIIWWIQFCVQKTPNLFLYNLYLNGDVMPYSIFLYIQK